MPYSLELGGKDAAIVLADADFDRAGAGVAWGALFNSGQACVSIERVYVETSIYDTFIARLTDHVRALRQGADDDGYRYDIGAMAIEDQGDLVATQVFQALTAGANPMDPRKSKLLQRLLHAIAGRAPRRLPKVGR